MGAWAAEGADGEARKAGQRWGRAIRGSVPRKGQRDDGARRRRSLEMETQKELFESVKTMDLTKLQELHLKGADLSALDQSGCSILHHAVDSGSKETVSYIVKNAPNLLDVADTLLGETALHRAASRGQRTICGFLVDAGAELMKPDAQVTHGHMVLPLVQETSVLMSN
uniref:Uncharacterized protein n=1 Tax=Knipowitschia caucasica TaxID=637954 RepID=A0AAV2L9K5_KNICA